MSTEILRVTVAIRKSLLQNKPLCESTSNAHKAFDGRELRFPTTDTTHNFRVDRTLAFAHQEDAVWVKPREVAELSTEGKNIWEVVLSEDTTGKVYKHRTEQVHFESLTLDQIADMRARRILLNEKIENLNTDLSLTTTFDQLLLEVQIRGELSSQYGNRLQALTSPIPELYQHFKTRPETFEKLARLVSILYLKLSDTVEDILQLELKLHDSTGLQVKFKGRRSQLYVNKEPALLEFEGVCPLPQ